MYNYESEYDIFPIKTHAYIDNIYIEDVQETSMVIISKWWIFMVCIPMNR